MVAITAWITVLAIDSVVNCWCVFLMYKYNQKMFRFICGGCHRCIVNCIYCCIQCRKGLEKEEFLQVYSPKATESGTEIELKMRTRLKVAIRSSTDDARTSTLYAYV